MPTTLNHFRQFAALDMAQKGIFVQAWFMLGYMRAAILITTFKHLSASLRHHRDTVSASPVDEAQLQQAEIIGRLVTRAARHTPWKSLCLVQVLVTQRLLSRRHIPGQFYLGVRKELPLAQAESDPGSLAAHAWLDCGGVIVNGGQGHRLFTVVSTFSWSADD